MMSHRRSRINEHQKRILVDFLESRANLINGPVTPSFNLKDRNKLWQEVADILNACGSGAQKTMEGWKGCWGDIKTHTKTKATLYKKSLQSSGGAYPDSTPLNDLDMKVLTLMGERSYLDFINTSGDDGVEPMEQKIIVQEFILPEKPDLPMILEVHSSNEPEHSSPSAEAASPYQAVVEENPGPSDSASQHSELLPVRRKENAKRFETRTQTLRDLADIQRETLDLKRRRVELEERRTEAEERRATAEERRAVAEELKAEAQQEMAKTLKALLLLQQKK